MLIRTAIAAMIFAAASVCSAAPIKGDRAPDFKAATNSGATLSLADYSGKVVILDFFATWCPSCRKAVPFLVELEKKYRVKVIGMDVEETGKEKINSYIRENSVDFPVVYANDDVQGSYGIRSVPVLYIVGKDGTISGKFQGYNNEIAAAMETLIKQLR
jgi:thiol-disulfide isomerase/thioredoxin